MIVRSAFGIVSSCGSVSAATRPDERLSRVVSAESPILIYLCVAVAACSWTSLAPGVVLLLDQSCSWTNQSCSWASLACGPVGRLCWSYNNRPSAKHHHSRKCSFLNSERSPRVLLQSRPFVLSGCSLYFALYEGFRLSACTSSGYTLSAGVVAHAWITPNRAPRPLVSDVPHRNVRVSCGKRPL